MSIGKNLKRLRIEKKISPDYLAQQIGKGGRQWIYDLEKGKIKRVLDEDVEMLAKILGTTVSELKKRTDLGQTNESLEFTSSEIDANLKKLSGFKEKYYYLLEENRRLWVENSHLKSVLLKNKINPYNTDNQDDTL